MRIVMLILFGVVVGAMASNSPDVVFTGDNPSASMYKNSYFSGREKVATFFGHVNDMSVCKMAADALNKPENNGSPGLYDCAPLIKSEYIGR